MFSQPNKEALIELKTHSELGNLNEKISKRLEEYFLNGGTLDDSDWLFLLQSQITDIENISEFIRWRNERIEIKEDDILRILKSTGFFRKNTKAKPTNDTYSILRKELTEFSANIALKDKSKAFLIDIEADVCRENNAYILFLKELEDISDNNFVPTNMEEKWDTDFGPIQVKFSIDGKEYIFKPTYNDDWLDGEIIKDVNNSLNEKSCGFYTLKSDYITGQELVIFFLKDNEKAILEKELNWQLEKL